MNSFEKVIGDTIISELIATLEKRSLPIISEQADIAEVVEAMASFEHSRLLYMVDENRRLMGIISLGALSRHIFSPSHEPQIHPRFLMSMITAESAKDIMQKDVLFATGEEKVIAVLKKMIRRNVKEVPVLDKENKVIADFTMLDLLKFITHSRAREKHK
jgi:CBS domain-containing protein